MSKSDKSKISKVAPPTELPSFVLEQKSKETGENKFQAAIPPEQNSKQYNIDENPVDVTKIEEEKNEADELPSMQDIAQALSPLTDGVKNSVLFGWMKDSLKSSMDIAKEGVQKVVVTLDPQMSGILFSGGDIEVIVSSNNEDKIDPVREAFQEIFKKATIYGRGSQAKSIADQPVGFQSAELSAKERINQLRLNEMYIDKVILSVENFLLEVSDLHWFDLGLLLLSDSKNNLTLKTFTQMTPIPYEMIKKMQDETLKDYEKKETGYGLTVGNVMSKYLEVPHYEWHKMYTSIDRRDMIYAAAKSLATIYKRELQIKFNAVDKKTEGTK